MELIIVNESPHSVPRQFVTAWMKRVLLELKRSKVVKASRLKQELTLVFLDRKSAKKINLEFRGKAYATDVLSFESLDPRSWGELILCPEVLRDQARDHGLSYRHELGYMLIHGFLHLLGYDHERSTKEARLMFSLQDTLFNKLVEDL